MNVADIARQYNLHYIPLNDFIRQSRFPHRIDPMDGSLIIDDYRVQSLVQAYNESLQRAVSSVSEYQLAEKARDLPITSSYNFEGYRIVRYGGYVSGDEMIVFDKMNDDKLTGDSEKMMHALREIRSKALQELKEAAVSLGCNAVIALDFDYINIETVCGISVNGNQYFGLTANGTAVCIEKIAE